MQKLSVDLMPVGSVPEDDVQNYISWAWRMRDITNLDIPVLGYPRACMARAKSGDDTVMMVPFHPVITYEPLSYSPDLSPRMRALCLARIFGEVEKAMQETGHREQFFLTADDSVADAAARHGWTEVKGFRVMKRRMPGPGIQHYGNH